MIRPATLSDIPRIVDLGEMLHAESEYRSIPFSRSKVAKLMTALIVRDGVVFLAEKDGVVIGGIAGGVTEHWFSDTELVGFEYSFFLEPSGRHGITAARLIRAFKAWCKAKGAKQARMGITTGINVEGTAKFYRSQGFVDAGLLFTVEL